MSSGRPVVLLASDGPATRIVYHALEREFPDVRVILEARQSRVRLARRRLVRLGPLTLLGQVAFMMIVEPILRRRGARRIQAIKREFRLDDSPIGGAIIKVPSVNSDEARTVLRGLDPSVIVVNGTRIIGTDMLTAIRVPIINTHMGITPTYRGVHGGYWALAEGRPDLVGTTVHLVDGGIDTGSIIAQATFTVAATDTFATYPYLHLAVGIPILIDAVRAARIGALGPRPAVPMGYSTLRSHPTVWGYLSARLIRGVR